MLRKLFLLKLALWISVVLVELLLRKCDFPTNKRWVWQPNLTKTFQPDSAIFVGIKGSSDFTINQLGYRGDLFQANTVNYLCLGGSTTECLYLANSETWPSVLQQELNKNNQSQKIIIGNLGKSGVSAYDNYLHLKYYVPQLSHVKGVIFMVGLNDAMRLLKEPTNFDIAYDLAIEEERTQAIFQQSLVNGKWWSQIKLVQLAYQVYFQWQQSKVEWLVQDTRGKTLQHWRENRQATQQWIDTLPSHEYALRNYQKILNLILIEAQNQSISLCFISQASMYKDSMIATENKLLWMGGVGDFQQNAGNAYYSPKAIGQLLEKYNQATADFCKKNNLRFVDISTALPKDTSVFYDDCHFNENGACLVAKEVVKQIEF
jgi:lysophospholipase L1-like esterase